MQGVDFMKITASASCDISRSYIVEKCAGLFDLSLEDRAAVEFNVELPELEDDWRIGVVTGPSGSGKSTVAREAYGDRLYQAGGWDHDKAVVDCFPIRDVKKITQTLTSVGFSSPPAWIKPYRVLSNGEKFRCDLTRALLAADDVCVFDEFTSVVDRTVAQVGSAALAKTLRKKRVECKFVAVTCHYDVIDWLQPDWVLDMASCQLARGCLRPRPAMELTIRRCHRRAWRLFSQHHYLDTKDLSSSSECYIGLLDDQTPVAFVAVLNALARRRHKRLSRIVTLPDYQGIGIGAAMSNAVAEYLQRKKNAVTITTTHPAMIHAFHRSPRWNLVHVQPHGKRDRNCIADQVRMNSQRSNRVRVSFKFRKSTKEMAHV